MKKKELEKALDIYDRFSTGIMPENEQEEKLLHKFLEFMGF